MPGVTEMDPGPFNTILSGPLARVTTYDPDGKYYILAERLPNGHLIVSRDELENLYRETLQKSRAAQRLDAAALGRHGMRVTRKGVTRLRCWSLDRFLNKRGVSDASHPLVKEYCRQLFEQARGLNSMSSSEYLNEREWFTAHGRLNNQAEFREEHLQTVVYDFLKSGQYTSIVAARAAAEKSIFGLVPLHTPDQVVSGRLSVIERLGLDSVNSSLGGG